MKILNIALIALITINLIGCTNPQNETNNHIPEDIKSESSILNDEPTEAEPTEAPGHTQVGNVKFTTEATFFGSEYKYWSDNASIPQSPFYDSHYEPNLLVCSTISTIPLGSLIELSFEDSEHQVRKVVVVVTENDVLIDEHIGIVMEREAYAQLFEYNSDGFLPSLFTKVDCEIIDYLKY
ncbi:MAG: hypothetical protein H6599_02465 [Flavobacteriales bacterium]|nr:hypothetical protein [Flavobacteriales bacterium]